MKKLNCLLLVSLVLLLIAGCSKQEVQSDALKSDEVVTVEKAKPNQFVPFNATFEVYVDLSSVLMVIEGDELPDPPPFYEGPPFVKYQEVYGEGNATHLGKTEVMIEQWWRPIPPEPNEVKRGTGCGEIYLTAANGDILHADYNGAIAIHYAGPPYYVITTLTGNFKDGGTGRFAYAEGEFLWEVEFYPLDNFGTVTVTGVIKYSK